MGVRRALVRADLGGAGKLVNESSRRPAHPGVIIARSSRRPETAWLANRVAGVLRQSSGCSPDRRVVVFVMRRCRGLFYQTAASPPRSSDPIYFVGGGLPCIPAVASYPAYPAYTAYLSRSSPPVRVLSSHPPDFPEFSLIFPKKRKKS